MTSEDRNRRMKWGHSVPRWWISDFNMTHRDCTNENESSHHVPDTPPEVSGDDLLKSAGAQIFRQRLLNQQTNWAESQRQSASLGPRAEDPETSEKYRLKRIARRRKAEERSRQLNRDIRLIQAVFVVLVIAAGLLFGGLLGLLVCTAIGLLIMSLRFKF